MYFPAVFRREGRSKRAFSPPRNISAGALKSPAVFYARAWKCILSGRVFYISLGNIYRAISH